MGEPEDSMLTRPPRNDLGGKCAGGVNRIEPRKRP